MVNIGASFGPLILGRLRAISWEYAYIAAAVAVGLMFIITLFFYHEPERAIEGETLRKKFKDMAVALSDIKFLTFLLILGLFSGCLSGPFQSIFQNMLNNHGWRCSLQ
jgi:MFS family permease